MASRVKRKRLTRAEVVHVSASCSSCSWGSLAKNALANAARHHDSTGHTVETEQTMRIVYGQPRAPQPDHLPGVA